MDHSGDMADCYHGGNIRCYGFVQDFGLCVRVNTLGTYAEANKQVSKIPPINSKGVRTGVGIGVAVRILGKKEIFATLYKNVFFYINI